ncbi:MAG: hypothetical protein GY714_27235 [Desulfobacterales bacterium]|nr:hypothetical protein [Desulfobacterales bacterium]MCP4160754.1 hypothetical protein [Deltaproteobacteria bacterium]
MLLTEKSNSIDVCTTLFFHLSSTGLKISEINSLVSDVFNIIKEGGDFTQGLLNQTLSEMGWQKDIVDEYSLQLIMSILETEFNFKVTAKSLH